MKVAIIGTGIMGTGVGLTLRKKGHEVTCWNRTQANAKELLDAGAAWRATPRQAAEGADHVVILVWNETALRAALEALAVILVVQSGQSEILDQLEELLRSMQASVNADHMAGVVQTDFEFHETLCRACGNQRLVNIWLSMSVQIRALVSVNDLRYLKPQEIVPRHSSLVAAMRASDAERAMRLLVTDILEAGEYVATSLAASQ